jgi:hypothetical protein
MAYEGEMSMRTRWLPWISLGLFVTLFLALPLGAAPTRGQTLTVRVLSAKVMQKPRFIGAVASAVSRGDHLTFEEAQKDWYKVRTSAGKDGWIHRTNVTESQVRLSSKPGGGGGSLSQDEVELAGRGFTPEVEKEYRDKHRELDFSHVDRIEATSPRPEDLAQFAQEGGLGGAP